MPCQRTCAFGHSMQVLEFRGARGKMSEAWIEGETMELTGKTIELARPFLFSFHFHLRLPLESVLAQLVPLDIPKGFEQSLIFVLAPHNNIGQSKVGDVINPPSPSPTYKVFTRWCSEPHCPANHSKDIFVTLPNQRGGDLSISGEVLWEFRLLRMTQLRALQQHVTP